MSFRQYFTTALVYALATTLSAATIVVDVRDPKAAPLSDAVVFATPEGREMRAASRTAVMDQKNKTFVPRVLPVQVGTAVKFPNSDDIQHQVYSFSPAKTFNLPLYKGTPANPIVFSAPGVVTLGCNIHDTMNAYIVVVDTPYFEKSESSGRTELRNLPAGKYVVRVWHPDMKDEPAPQSVAVGESERAELAFTVVAAPKAMTTAPLNKTEDKFKRYGGHGRP
jgi:plastocyanin